jgi:hypothetical protein
VGIVSTAGGALPPVPLTGGSEPPLPATLPLPPAGMLAPPTPAAPLPPAVAPAPPLLLGGALVPAIADAPAVPPAAPAVAPAPPPFTGPTDWVPAFGSGLLLLSFGSLPQSAQSSSSSTDKLAIALATGFVVMLLAPGLESVVRCARRDPGAHGLQLHRADG